MKKNVKIALTSAAAVILLTVGIAGFMAKENGAFFNPSDFNTERDVNHNKAEIEDNDREITNDKSDNKSKNERKVNIDENFNKTNVSQQDGSFGNRDKKREISDESSKNSGNGRGLYGSDFSDDEKLLEPSGVEEDLPAEPADIADKEDKDDKADIKKKTTTLLYENTTTAYTTENTTEATTKNVIKSKPEKSTTTVTVETESETTTEEDFHAIESGNVYSVIGGGGAGINIGTGDNSGENGTAFAVADCLPKLPVENVLNSDDMPETGIEAGRGGSSNHDKSDVSLFIIDNELGYIDNNIYCGQSITDWDVFCSMYVYIIVDEDMYRFTELNPDLIRFGEYPENPTQNFEVEVFARANKNSEWLSQTVTVDVVDYKLQIVDGNNNTISSEMGTNLAYINPTDGSNKVKISNYLQYCYENTDGPLSKLFEGWTTNPDGSGDVYNYEFTFANKGKTVLYPLPYEDIDTEKYIAYKQLCWEKFEVLQVLTQYKGTDGIIDVPNGINCVNVDTVFDVMKIPQTVCDVHVSGLTYTCNNAYEVDDNNQYYSSENGILYDKDKTKIVDIPVNIKDVVVPDSVNGVGIGYSNCIENIKFTSSTPPTIDLRKLSGARIVVPGEYYKNYFIAWSSKLGDNTLVADGEIKENLYQENGYIYSDDKKILYVLPSEDKSFYDIADGVAVISGTAFDGKNASYAAKLPKSIEKLEDGAFNNTSIKKIVFTGEIPPEISYNTFGTDITVYVPATARDAYIEKWSDILGREACENLISTNEVEIKKDNLGSSVMTENGSTAIIELSDDIENISKDYNELAGVEITELAPYSCENRKNLKAVVLPESVKKIGDYAFSDCNNLELVFGTAWDEITVGDGVFDSANALKTVVFSAKKANMEYPSYNFANYYAPVGSTGYASNYEYLNYYYYSVEANGGVFIYGNNPYDEEDYPHGKYLLGASSEISGEVVLEDNTVAIYDSALKKCQNEFWFDKNSMKYLGYIGEYACSDSGLSGELEFGENLEGIAECAFYKCPNITSVTIPENVSVFETAAFSNCTSLKKVVINSRYITDIPEYAFDECNCLESVVFGDNSSVETIYDYAFSNTVVKELELPATLRTLYNGFVDYSADFEKLEFKSEVPPDLLENRYWFATGEDYNFGADISGDFRVVVPSGSEKDYIDAWRKQLITGKDANDYTEEEVFRCENAVRRYLGMDEIGYDEFMEEFSKEEQPEKDITTEESTEQTTEDETNVDLDHWWIEYETEDETEDAKDVNLDYWHVEYETEDVEEEKTDADEEEITENGDVEIATVNEETEETQTEAEATQEIIEEYTEEVSEENVEDDLSGGEV